MENSFGVSLVSLNSTLSANPVLRCREWRLRTYNSIVYGSASDEDMLAGKWYEIGTSKDFRTCECPSFYPLPAASPGFEREYDAAKDSLPTHVHKTSCGGDWWQLGTYDAGAPKTLGSFKATPGWEDLFAQRKIDQGLQAIDWGLWFAECHDPRSFLRKQGQLVSHCEE